MTYFGTYFCPTISTTKRNLAEMQTSLYVLRWSLNTFVFILFKLFIGIQCI